MRKTSITLPNPHPASDFLIVSGALMLLGTVMIFSAAASVAESSAGHWLSRQEVKQVAYVLLALSGMWLVTRTDVTDWQFRLTRPSGPAVYLLIGCTVLLVLALIPGVGLEVNGARRWIRVGTPPYSITIQPSEFAKYALVIFLACYCHWRSKDMHQFRRGLLPALLIVAVVCLLTVLEDFGTAALIAAVSLIVLWLGGARWWHVAALIPAAAVAGLPFLLAEPYRLRRLLIFLNPWSDPTGAGYHPIQSMLTVHGGGVWGVGLGNSVQKLGYLPEDTTDFIFAVICEELGMAGTLLVMGTFIVLIYLGWRAISRTQNPLGQLLAASITTVIATQVIFNIAVVTVTVPTKGIGLPLISAGGSGLLATSLAMGVVASVWRGQPRLAVGKHR